MKDFVTLHIKVPIWKTEDGWFVASFVPWNAHGQGKTEAAAVTSLKQALQSVIEIGLEDGTIGQILQAANAPVSDAGEGRAQHHAVHRGGKHGAAHGMRNIVVPIPTAAAIHAAA